MLVCSLNIGHNFTLKGIRMRGWHLLKPYKALLWMLMLWPDELWRGSIHRLTPIGDDVLPGEPGS